MSLPGKSYTSRAGSCCLRQHQVSPSGCQISGVASREWDEGQIRSESWRRNSREPVCDWSTSSTELTGQRSNVSEQPTRLTQRSVSLRLSSRCSDPDNRSDSVYEESSLDHDVDPRVHPHQAPRGRRRDASCSMQCEQPDRPAALQRVRASCRARGWPQPPPPGSVLHREGLILAVGTGYANLTDRSVAILTTAEHNAAETIRAHIDELGRYGRRTGVGSSAFWPENNSCAVISIVGE